MMRLMVAAHALVAALLLTFGVGGSTPAEAGYYRTGYYGGPYRGYYRGPRVVVRTSYYRGGGYYRGPRYGYSRPYYGGGYYSRPYYTSSLVPGRWGAADYYYNGGYRDAGYYGDGYGDGYYGDGYYGGGYVGASYGGGWGYGGCREAYIPYGWTWYRATNC